MHGNIVAATLDAGISPLLKLAGPPVTVLIAISP
jgi:hypothetical protein